MTFLVDENLPRSLVPALRRAGFDAEDVRDRGLGGRDDVEVLAYAMSYRRIVMPTARLNAAILAAVRDLRPENFIGSIVVISPRGVRIRWVR